MEKSLLTTQEAAEGRRRPLPAGHVILALPMPARPTRRIRAQDLRLDPQSRGACATFAGKVSRPPSQLGPAPVPVQGRPER